MSSTLPVLPPALAPSVDSPASMVSDDGRPMSGSDSSREHRAHPTAHDHASPAQDDAEDDQDDDGYDEYPQSGSEGEQEMTDLDMLEADESEEDELAYDHDDEPAVEIDVSDLTGHPRSPHHNDNNRRQDGSRSGGGGGSGSRTGAGGGSSAGTGTDAFQSKGRNPLNRRSGTGNGSKKGKGWRAAVLPVEILNRIIDLVANDLIRTASRDARPGVRSHEVAYSGWPKRDLLTYLQCRGDLVQLRLVARSWNRAVEDARFWHMLAWVTFGDRLRGNPPVTLERCRAWLTRFCVICIANGYRDNWSVVDEVSTIAGPVACCRTHKQSTCYRCLFGPWTHDLRGPDDRDRYLVGSEGDMDWFGDGNPQSCRYCRHEVLDDELRSRGIRRFSLEDDTDPGRDPAFQYLYYGDGDGSSTAIEIVERRWLARHTKFAAILEQALESRRFIKPANKPRNARDLAAIRRALRGIADGDEQNEEMEDLGEDEFLSEEESEDESELLSHAEVVQVAEMALHAYLLERIVQGYWISPGEQRLALIAARLVDPSTTVLEHTFDVAQPLLPYAQPTAFNVPHPPFMRQNTPSPLPRETGALLAGADYLYAGALRAVLLPAMEQIVRLVGQVQDPIKLASSYTVADVLSLLRKPGAWVPGGLDYLVPYARATEARQLSTSTRSSMSSNASVDTPPTDPTNGRVSRQPSEDRSEKEQSPFIGPRPSTNGSGLPAGRDGPSPMHSVSSHSPSPSTTVPSVSTPPSSTSPPPPSNRTIPPPSPRKQGTVLLPNPASASTARSPPAQAVLTSLPPLPLGAASVKPIHPIPCLPTEGALLGSGTIKVIQDAWHSAWEPLRRCHCAICLRGMGFPSAETEIAGADRNGNGKRKGDDESGLVRMPPEAAEDPAGVIGLGLTGSDDDGSVKRARTETA